MDTAQNLLQLCLFFFLVCFGVFSHLKVDHREVIIATTMTAMAPLLPIAWGQAWVGVVGVTSATVLDMDRHRLSTVLTLTLQFLWYMAWSPLRSMLTRSSTSFAYMAM